MSFRNSLFYIRYKNFLKQINHKEIYKELDQSQRIDISYIALVVISAHIATLGLIVNSSAVIIGAMIIAPLMGPIMAGGLSFAISDNYLGGKAFKSISLGIILSVFFSATVTFISPLKENTTEILIRTSPNIMDLFIALFSGLAGAFAVTFKKISGSIVGVAISVALMPPLCVTGIGISTGQANVIVGGFFLFLTNLTAIFIASAIFFLVFGFWGHGNQSYDRKAIYTKYIVSFFLLLLLSIPLIYTLEAAIKEKIQLDKIKNVLVSNFDNTDYSRLDSWKKTQNTVYIKINTVTYIPQEKIDFVEKEIRTVAGQDVALDI
ncbi:MAG: TIGR00341 family protein, partial [Syntrophomonadaceae bacterium]|nr:TIGR00341 family protein [Syntrophomonadaceae bacterium]